LELKGEAMSWFKGMHRQKSMVQWAKRQYHEAFELYRMDQRAYPDDEATAAANRARVRAFEDVLLYLTGNETWSD
jgi:hypothetical protein